MMAYIEDNHLITIIIRLFIALVLSGLIGLERELKNQPAGFRTHILVGIGACLMMILSLYGFDKFIFSSGNIRFDPARIPSYVISGIGFLGAGTIIVSGTNIKGLTTAASIWAVAGLGLVVGVGMYGAAVFTTLMILISLIFLNKLEKRFGNSSPYFIEIIALSKLPVYRIISIFESNAVPIENIEIKADREDSRRIIIYIKRNTDLNKTTLYDDILNLYDVKNIFQKG